MIPRTVLRIVAPLIAAVALLSACAKSSGTHAAAATVNGVEITDATVALNDRLFTFLGSLNGAPCGTPFDAEESAAAACSRFSLSSLIQERFISGYADENTITIEKPEIDSTIADVESSLGGAAALDQKLKESKVTRTELNDLIRRILLFQAVQKAVATAALTDEALRRSYDDNQIQYTTIHVEHILVATEAEANDVYDEVTAPGFSEQDFMDLATKISTDPGAKENAGEYPDAPASQYVPEFANAALALEPGQIARPVESEFGWHVIRLVSKTVTPFDQVKEQIIQSLSGQSFQDWLDGQVKAAKIEVNPKYGSFDLTTQEVVPVRSTATGSASPTPVTASP